ncbi:MAG: exosortase/archaeosortase family protein [Candidatus Thermoplasmatota archaeon]|nr:exosortase/archaeosortase family protein [Candidatus Thermoplasmatota archaeon]
MAFSWEAFIGFFDRTLPPGTPMRKLLQILAVVLLFEGVSVILLFSKAGIFAGILSIALGIFLLLVLYPGKEEEAPERRKIRAPPPQITDTPGLKLMDFVYSKVGGAVAFIAAGLLIIVAVLAWNVFYSPRASLGDLDTLSILLGVILIAYPFAVRKYKVEAAFALLFIALVVMFLVVPQAVMSTRSEAGSSIGNWYVEYMLARPFAGILNLIGIDASSSGNMVSIVFQDGTVQPLGISAYCAGLYSFSIFLAAFFSFVLTFERLPARILAVVLAVGLVIAFLGNLLRMVIIGIIGYYEGIKALIWAHENVGWIIFLSWSAVFWYLLLGYTSKHGIRNGPAAEAN